MSEQCPSHPKGVHYFATIGTETVCIDCGKKMTNWQSHLTPSEQRRLEIIEAAIAKWKAERQTLHNRAKVRRHRAKD